MREVGARPSSFHTLLRSILGLDTLLVGGLVVGRSWAGVFAVGATAGVVRVVAGGGLLGGEIFARGLATLFAFANIFAGQAELDAVRARSLAIALGS